MTTTAATESAVLLRRALEELERVIVGRSHALRTLLVGVLSGGHVLIEDLPGTGKTLMAKTLGSVLGLQYTRLQFTPDLLPSDVVGFPVLDPLRQELVFRPGPVFTNLLLADEINRTPPKTQSALLEAMSETSVSVDGVSRPLPKPFIVLATDNPIEYEGTYPLPEAQLDRFMLRLRVGHLGPDQERELVRRRLDRATPEPGPGQQVMTGKDLLDLRQAVEAVHVDPAIVDYVVRLVTASREHRDVVVGASPRGTLALTQVARGRALLHGRDYVVPQDVKAMAVPALGHRIVVRPELWVRRVDGDEVVRQLLSGVETPQTPLEDPDQ